MFMYSPDFFFFYKHSWQFYWITLITKKKHDFSNDILYMHIQSVNYKIVQIFYIVQGHLERWHHTITPSSKRDGKSVNLMPFLSHRCGGYHVCMTCPGHYCKSSALQGCVSWAALISWGRKALPIVSFMHITKSANICFGFEFIYFNVCILRLPKDIFLMSLQQLCFMQLWVSVKIFAPDRSSQRWTRHILLVFCVLQNPNFLLWVDTNESSQFQTMSFTFCIKINYIMLPML